MAIKQLEKRAIDVLLSLGELSNKYSENLVMSEQLSSYIFRTQHSASSNVSLKDFVRSHKVGDIQQRHMTGGGLNTVFIVFYALSF